MPKSKRIAIREFLDSDIDFVASNMRKEDQEEVKALLDLDPKKALIYSVENSHEVWTFHVDGVPAAIFGISDHTEPDDEARSGLIWTLGTDQFFKYKKETCNLASKVFENWLEEYDVLYNYIWEGNKTHQNWLKRMGFIIFEEEFIEGIEGDKFFFFANFSYPVEE